MCVCQCATNAKNIKKINKNGTMGCQLISLPDTNTVQMLISTLVVVQVISLHLSQHVRPDVKGNIVEGIGSPNNERHTTSP